MVADGYGRTSRVTPTRSHPEFGVGDTVVVQMLDELFYGHVTSPTGYFKGQVPPSVEISVKRGELVYVVTESGDTLPFNSSTMIFMQKVNPREEIGKVRRRALGTISELADAGKLEEVKDVVNKTYRTLGFLQELFPSV